MKKFIKSTAGKCLIAFLWIFFALTCLLLLDKDNQYRPDYFNKNFISGFLNMFDLGRFNVTKGAWYAFIAFSAIIVLITIFSILKPVFSNKLKNKNADLPENLAKRQSRVFSVLYILITIIVVALVLFVLWAFGIFDKLNKTGNLKGGTSVVKTGEVVKNIITTVGFFALFVFLIPGVLWVLYKIIKGIASVSSKYVAKTAAETLQQEKYDEFLNAAQEIIDEKKNGKKGLASTEDAPVMFPNLLAIDEKYKDLEKEEVEPDTISLDEFILRFQSYLCNTQKLYYDLPMLRAFVSSLASSRMIILEGLSGTGKSSLPRYFADFINEKAFFAPVQATWRDRGDVVGYYNDFNKTFKETNFLKNLYEASYNQEDINLVVLDELNLSRVEYYFADFLSVLEYPSEDWRIDLLQTTLEDNVPEKFENMQLKIPENTWFICTANKDDSTFTITDKVYDRAMVLNFLERNEKIMSDIPSDRLNVTTSSLTQLFKDAQADENNCLSQEDWDKFLVLCNFTLDTFEIRFGNRIMNQIDLFVPVYVACGGTKEQALDLMFARKVVRKLEGKYDDYIKDGLNQLSSLIIKTYGKDVFVETETALNNLKKKLL